MQRVQSKAEQLISIAPDIHRLVRKLDNGNSDCEDIAQDILLKLLSNPDVMPHNVNPGWLYAVVSNAVHDFYRTLKRECRYLDRTVSTDTVGFVSEYDDQVVYSICACFQTQPVSQEPDLFPRIRRFFADLSDSHRQVLTLSMLGKSYLEIAKLTQASPGTVRSRLHYARKKAQAELAAYR